MTAPIAMRLPERFGQAIGFLEVVRTTLERRGGTLFGVRVTHSGLVVSGGFDFADRELTLVTCAGGWATALNGATLSPYDVAHRLLGMHTAVVQRGLVPRPRRRREVV